MATHRGGRPSAIVTHNLQDTVIRLRKSGYTLQQIKDYIQENKGINVGLHSISYFLSLNTSKVQSSTSNPSIDKIFKDLEYYLDILPSHLGTRERHAYRKRLKDAKLMVDDLTEGNPTQETDIDRWNYDLGQLGYALHEKFPRASRLVQKWVDEQIEKRSRSFEGK